MKIPHLSYVKKLITIFLFLLLEFSVTSLILNNVQPVLSQDGTVLAVDPTVCTGNPESHIRVWVNVTSVTDLKTWGFTLGWKRVGAPLLDCVSVTEDTSFFDGTFHFETYIDHVDIASTLVGAVPGVTGNGKLAMFAFNVIETGNCTLALYNTGMTNSTGYEISHTVRNGTFYTTLPKAKFTYSPNPSERPECYGRPIVGENVTFNATSSFDPDQVYKGQTGTGIDSYEWDFDDGTTGTGNVTTHAYDDAGKYAVTLTVTDDDYEADIETYPPEKLKIFLHEIAVINVTVVNDPPEVKVGGTVYINATVINQGSDTEYLNVTTYFNLYPVNTTIFHYVTYPPPPTPPQHHYSLKSGGNATTTIAVDTTGFPKGEYTVEVKAFLIHSVYKNMSVSGIEPNLYNNGMTDGTVTLTGVTRHEIAVTSLKAYPTNVELNEWSKIEVKVKNKGTVPENFNATVNVYHDSSLFNTTSWSNQTIDTGVTKTLSLFYWFKGTDHAQEGSYNATVNVCIVNATTLQEIPDEDTTNNLLNKTFEILLIPVASFTYSPKNPFIDQTVTFNATGSYAPGADGGTIVEYAWNFGDGITEIYVDANLTDITTHAFSATATYTVTLTVKDDVGLEDEVSLTVIVPVHNVAVENVAFSPGVVTTGELISVIVTVENMGHTNETFDVTAYYEVGVIGKETVTNLTVNANTTLAFTWNTTGVAGGDYTVWAGASVVDGETETADNNYTGGTATIKKRGSTVTISASPTSFTVGETTTINGTIHPVRSGVSITIWYMLSGGDWSALPVVTTDGAGTYSCSWTPEETGSYAIKATCAGDDTTMPSESETKVVVAEEAQRLDVFQYTTAALAVILVATIAYFVWIRKPKPV